MLSRVADSIYWMSRYVERADNIARVVDVNLNLMLDSSDGSAQQWDPLIYTMGDHERFKARFGEATTQDNVTHFLTFDEENPNSILSCLRSARENARSIREIISSEMWLHLNKFYLLVNSAASAGRGLESPHQFFSDIKASSFLFTGVTDATLTHGESWHFAKLGQELERADKTSRILDVKYFILLPSVNDVGSAFDDVQWAAVLRSCSAFEMYRKKHGKITPSSIVDFLLLNAQFPRSIRYCSNAAQASLHAISGTPLGNFRTPPEKLLGQLCSDLAYDNVEEVLQNGLHEYLDELQTTMNKVGAGVHHIFFSRRLPTPKTVSKERVQ
ncbi:MAG: hypothetical protein JWN25_1776 [Verrucomicrobiales bacterium]|nr:hypothetical protein [Verrucomicrobiales bacterium]MDB6129780.1 hypothetical protein [Verrucomicrobiales bacterium]